ncbi:hypothetical protein HDU77_006653 [Chytriomyces hyalinus]|nr:hypothetical protein HDU77_006653 [Chytriomyces hyalinus]
MLLSDNEAATLQTYLGTLLEKICDADPTVLAEYVIALLKHDKSDSELRALCIDQLDEFLKTETLPFVDKLFESIRTRAYLESSQPLAKSAGPITQSAPATKRARSNVPDESSEVAGAGAGNALDTDIDADADLDEDDQFRRNRRKKRFGVVDSDSQDDNGNSIDQRDDRFLNAGRRGNFNQQSQSNARMNQQQMPYMPQQHVQQQQWGQPIPVMQMQNQMHLSHGSRGSPFGMRGGFNGQSQRRNKCYEFDARGTCSRGDMCRYDHGAPSNMPIMNMGMGGMMQMGSGGPMPFMNGNGNVPFLLGSNQMGPGPDGFPNVQPQAFDESGMAFNNSNTGFRGGMRGNFGPRGSMRGGSFRGGGMGMNNGGFHPYHSQNSNRMSGNNPRDTLIVENIPPEHCTLDAVNTYFKAFGTVTDIKVEPHAARAVVKYSRSEEAKAAHSSPSAVFDNRFVKVFFAPPQQQQQQQMLPSGGPMSVGAGFASGQANSAVAGSGEESQMVDTQGSGDVSTTTPTTGEYPTALSGAAGATTAALERRKQLAKEKEAFVAKHMEEAKNLMAKLDDKSLTAAAKAMILKTLKTLNEIVANTMGDMSKEAAAKLEATTAPGVSGAAAASGSDDADVATLEALKAEAALIGVDATAAVAATTPTTQASTPLSGPILRGGPSAMMMRGGRGGSWRGGRGGGAVRYNLDLRTKKLLFHGALEADKSVLMGQIEPLGAVTSLDFSTVAGSLIIEFQQRKDAEIVLATGIKDSNAANLKLEWFEDKSVRPVSAVAAAATELAGENDSELLRNGELAS